MTEKTKTEIFIEKAKLKHGNSYKYTSTIFENSKTNILFECPIHGMKSQRPDVHLKSDGCNECSTELRKKQLTLTQEQFIGKIKKVHGDRYGYEPTIYVNTKSKIKVLCKIHGEFEIKASDHIRGSGCFECGKESMKKKKTYTQEQFLEKAKKVHGTRYGYEPTIYVKDDKKVKILCKIHGEFEITPNSHLRGSGCLQCGKESMKKQLALTQEQFLEKAKITHGTRYGYEPTNYINAKTNVKIECFLHGIFEQNPQEHIQGSGCPRCANGKNALKNRLTNEEIISRFKAVHGNKYEYLAFDYVNIHSNINIICPKHGEFQVKVDLHIKGKECEKCINEKTKDNFIQRGNIKHSDKYDYCKVNYVNGNVKVEIICPKHGSFWQKPSMHLLGGCKSCAIEKITSNTQEFIEKSNIIHNFKYGYSLTDYTNVKNNVIIICPIHGEFEQIPNSHMRGSGCTKCSILMVSDKLRKSTQEFIEQAKLIHGDKYEYDEVDYTNSKTKIKIICKIHGIFEQTPNSHLRGHGCPKCTSSISKQEQEINDFIKSLGLETEMSLDTIIHPKHLDIFVKSHNIAIEYNGLHWHSEQFRDKNYHLNKTLACEKLDIKLIHIFEDEWLEKEHIVKSRLLNLLKLTPNKIFARKCIIKEVSNKESREFLDNNHIQGNLNSKVKLGLYYENKLVSLMTFGSLRKNLGGNSKKDCYELGRFCNLINTNVVGGASKLFKHFLNNYQPKEIISYADKRWSQGDLYKTLGFHFIHDSAPSYFYVINEERKNRFGFRKDVLVKEGFDPNKTEHEIMLEREIYRIYDCGTLTYKLLL